MTFEQMKALTAADLRAIAQEFEKAAAEVDKGDLWKLDTILNQLSDWMQFLLIRHATRMDELRANEPTLLEG